MIVAVAMSRMSDCRSSSWRCEAVGMQCVSFASLLDRNPSVTLCCRTDSTALVDNVMLTDFESSL